MKTDISLPNNIFIEAEQISQNPRISKSALLVNALNKVYSEDYHNEFEPVSNASLESIRELTKNDMW